MNGLLQDLRYAVRTLRRSPGFAAVTVATLALGIGANTAIFTILDAALLRTLPVAEPHELVRLQTQRPSSVNTTLSYPLFEALRDGGAQIFDGTFAAAIEPVGLEGAAGARRVQAEFVTGGYLDVLGLDPAIGRGFTADEAASGDPVVLIAHGLWQRQFAGATTAIGQTIRVNGHPFTIIGVLPERYDGLVRGAETEVWAPLFSYPAVAGSRGDVTMWFEHAGVSWLSVFARMRGAGEGSLAATREAMAALDPRIDELGVRNPGETTRVEPAPTGLTWAVADFETPLRLVMAVVGLVLLIACANVAGLMLARARTRAREIAIRLSVGAPRGRLIRQLLTESTVLALAGGAAGLLLAMWGVDFFGNLPGDRGAPVMLDLSPDARVLGFTAGLALLSVVVFGLAPALRTTRRDLLPAIRADAPAATGGRRYGMRDALVVGQVALSLFLIVGAALMLGSVRNLGTVDLGYQTDDVLLVRLDTDARSYDDERRAAFFTRVRERVAALPGVQSAALADVVNPDPGGSRVEGAVIEGQEGRPGIEYEVITASAGYLETLGLPVLRGRGLQARDEGTLNILVNETMARRYWPDGALGGRIAFGDEWLRVIGVVADTRYRGLREGETNAVYVPLGRFGEGEMTLLARTRGEPGAALSAIRSEVASLDAGVPVFDARTLRAHVGRVFARERLAASLTTVFGVLALLLAAVGLYGVLAQAVARRRREIGLRMAVGASRSAVMGLVLRHGLVLALVGVAIGLLAAFAGTRLISSLLYGISATEPATFGAGAVLLVAVALAASWIPARRATRVDPMIALRQE